MAAMIRIVHPDGREYAVLPADFERGIDGDYQGFRAVAYESGEPYQGPKTAAAIAKAAEADAAPKGAAKGEKGE